MIISISQILGFSIVFTYDLLEDWGIDGVIDFFFLVSVDMRLFNIKTETMFEQANANIECIC